MSLARAWSENSDAVNPGGGLTSETAGGAPASARTISDAVMGTPARSAQRFARVARRTPGYVRSPLRGSGVNGAPEGRPNVARGGAKPQASGNPWNPPQDTGAVGGFPG